MSITHYKKEQAGDFAGSNWDNAKGIASITADLAAQGVTTTEPIAYRIGSSRYEPANYFIPSTEPLTVTVGGTAQFPTQFECGDISADATSVGEDSGFTFYGNKTVPWSPTMSNGTFELIRITASHLNFSGFRTSGFGSWFPAYRIQAAVENVTISNHVSYDDSCVIRIEAGSCDNLNMRNILAVNVASACFYFPDNSLSNSTFDDITIISGAQDGRDGVGAIYVGEGNSNITFNDVYISNTIDSLINNSEAVDQSAYVQGDGFILEDTASGLELNRCVVHGAGDAAFDIKSGSIVLNDCTGIATKFAFRFWGIGAEVNRPIALASESRGVTSGGCFEASGGVATINDPDFEVDVRASLSVSLESATSKAGCIGKLYVNGTGRKSEVTINGGSLIIKDGLPAFIGDATCVISLVGVLVNGVMKTETHTFTAASEHWSPA